MLKVPLMFPQLVLLSPKLTDCICEIWVMMFYPECCLSVETVQRFLGYQGVCKLSVIRAEERGRLGCLIWLVVAQLHPIISIWPRLMTNRRHDL